MERKAKDFLKGFNTELGDSNIYCSLQFFDDGFVQGINFPKIYLFDDCNDSVEYLEQLSLSRLVKTLSKVLKVAEQWLSFKVDDFFTEKKKELRVKFPHTKIKFNERNSLVYSVFVSGEYDEEKLFDSLDAIRQNFEYIFEGLKLEIDI